MTTPSLHESEVTQFAVAGTFLDGLVGQNFRMLGSALAPDVHLRALVPAGLREWTGAATISDQFAKWFGNTDAYELVDATVGEVGGRLHLRWRLRLRAERLGADWFTVEQQSYADIDEAGKIARLDLLCTGYRRERADV